MKKIKSVLVTVSLILLATSWSAVIASKGQSRATCSASCGEETVSCEGAGCAATDGVGCASTGSNGMLTGLEACAN